MTGVVAASADAPLTAIFITAGGSLLEALHRMGARDAPQFPVVSPKGDGRLVGAIGRKAIFAAYEAALG